MERMTHNMHDLVASEEQPQTGDFPYDPDHYRHPSQIDFDHTQ